MTMLDTEARDVRQKLMSFIHFIVSALFLLKINFGNIYAQFNFVSVILSPFHLGFPLTKCSDD